MHVTGPSEAHSNTSVPPSKVVLGLLALLVISHVVLAASYATLTPYRTAGVLLGQRGPDGPARVQDVGAPDERQHANYAARLLRGEGLPVFNPKDPNLYETYQSHQPPLYYFLAMIWGKALGVGGVETPEDGIKLRALNVVLGGFTVGAVFLLVWWGLRDAYAALTAACIPALLPMNAALSGAISNDPLLILLCSLCLALCAKGMRDGWSLTLAIGVGVVAGLAIITKTSGVVLLPGLALAAWGSRVRPNPSQFAAVLVPLIAIVLPWWWRNQSLYGDPLAMRAFNQAFVGSPQASAFIEGLGASTYWIQWVGWWTARSYIGVFGYMDIWLTDTGLRGGAPGLYIVGLLALAIGCVAWAAKAHRTESSERNVHILMLAVAIVVLVLFLRFNAQYFQAQARYLLPAIACLAAAVGYGYRQLLPQRPWAGLVILTLVLGGINLFALTRLGPAFEARTTGSVAQNTPSGTATP